MNINNIILLIVLFLSLFGIYGWYVSKNKKEQEKKFKELRMNKYGKVVKPYLNENLEGPYIKKFKDLTDIEINQVNNIWFECFPKLDNNNLIERGFSKDTIIWILKDIYSKEIKGYICGLESLEFIQFLNSKNIHDTDLYSIKNWNGIFINNLCVSKKYRNKGWGNKLIKTIINWANNTKKDYIHLLLDSDNKTALKLYTSNNFVIDKESLDSQTNKEIFTMVKMLSSNKINDDSDLNLSENFHALL